MTSLFKSCCVNLLKTKETLPYKDILISYLFALFCTFQTPDIKVFINSRKFSNTAELYPTPLTFLVFQEEQKGRITQWNSGQFYHPGKMPKMHQPHLKLLSLPSQKFLGNKMKLANIVFFTRKPTLILAKFHKDKYLSNLFIYLLVYLFCFLQSEFFQEWNYPHSQFSYTRHRKTSGCSNNQDTDISQLHLLK